MVKQRWGCIYKLTNTLNGKYYFGQTIDFKRRMNGHKNSQKKKKTYLARSIRKYGWDNFKQEILIDNVPTEDLDQLEICYIDIFDSANSKKGYNLTKGGDGTSGYTHTDETKKKMSTARRKNHSAEKGCIHFNKKNKKWFVITASPPKYIGCFNSREKALQSLNKFNATGEILESDIKGRKRGMGSITLTKYNTFITKYKKKYIGCFKTKELAEEALTKYIATGKIYLKLRRKPNGTISLTKFNTYQAVYKSKYIGRFKTKELAEEALKQYIKNIN